MEGGPLKQRPRSMGQVSGDAIVEGLASPVDKRALPGSRSRRETAATCATGCTAAASVIAARLVSSYRGTPLPAAASSSGALSLLNDALDELENGANSEILHVLPLLNEVLEARWAEIERRAVGVFVKGAVLLEGDGQSVESLSASMRAFRARADDIKRHLEEENARLREMVVVHIHAIIAAAFDRVEAELEDAALDGPLTADAFEEHAKEMLGEAKAFVVASCINAPRAEMQPFYNLDGFGLLMAAFNEKATQVLGYWRAHNKIASAAASSGVPKSPPRLDVPVGRALEEDDDEEAEEEGEREAADEADDELEADDEAAPPPAKEGAPRRASTSSEEAAQAAEESLTPRPSPSVRALGGITLSASAAPASPLALPERPTLRRASETPRTPPRGSDSSPPVSDASPPAPPCTPLARARPSPGLCKTRSVCTPTGTAPRRPAAVAALPTPGPASSPSTLRATPSRRPRRAALLPRTGSKGSPPVGASPFAHCDVDDRYFVEFAANPPPLPGLLPRVLSSRSRVKAMGFAGPASPPSPASTITASPPESPCSPLPTPTPAAKAKARGKAGSRSADELESSHTSDSDFRVAVATRIVIQ